MLSKPLDFPLGTDLGSASPPRILNSLVRKIINWPKISDDRKLHPTPRSTTPSTQSKLKIQGDQLKGVPHLSVYIKRQTRHPMCVHVSQDGHSLQSVCVPNTDVRILPNLSCGHLNFVRMHSKTVWVDRRQITIMSSNLLKKSNQIRC